MGVLVDLAVAPAVTWAAGCTSWFTLFDVTLWCIFRCCLAFEISEHTADKDKSVALSLHLDHDVFPHVASVSIFSRQEATLLLLLPSQACPRLTLSFLQVRDITKM